MYENKKVEDVYNLLLSAFEQEFNKTFRLLPKAFLRIFLKIISAVFLILYKLIGWYFLQIFPHTASFDPVTVLGVTLRPLVMWGRLVGVGDPFAATQWTGTVHAISYPIAFGRSVVAGTQLKSNLSGQVYITEGTVLINAETVVLNVRCVSQGTMGNLTVGDELSFVEPLGTVHRGASVTAIGVLGTDSEGEAAYRARVMNRYQSPPQGGAALDYRLWASGVPGVLQTYVYKDDDTATGVLVFVAGVSGLYVDRIPSPELRVAVGTACTYDPKTGLSTRKPVGAVLDPGNDGTYANVLPVSIVAYDVAIAGLVGVDPEGFAEVAKPLVENYFLGREPYIRGLSVDVNIKDKITRNALISIFNTVAEKFGASFGAVTMTGPGDGNSYTLSRGELSKLDGFTVNGTPF